MSDLIALLILMMMLVAAIGLCVYRFAWRQYTMGVHVNGFDVPIARVRHRPWRKPRGFDITQGRVFVRGEGVADVQPVWTVFPDA